MQLVLSKDCELWGNFMQFHIRAVSSGVFYHMIHVLISFSKASNMAPGMAMSLFPSVNNFNPDTSTTIRWISLKFLRWHSWSPEDSS